MGRTARERVARRLDKQRVISQELSSISVLPNKGRCTSRQAYKFLAIDPRKNYPQKPANCRSREIVYFPTSLVTYFACKKRFIHSENSDPCIVYVMSVNVAF